MARRVKSLEKQKKIRRMPNNQQFGLRALWVKQMSQEFKKKCPIPSASPSNDQAAQNTIFWQRVFDGINPNGKLSQGERPITKERAKELDYFLLGNTDRVKITAKFGGTERLESVDLAALNPLYVFERAGADCYYRVATKAERKSPDTKLFKIHKGKVTPVSGALKNKTGEDQKE